MRVLLISANTEQIVMPVFPVGLASLKTLYVIEYGMIMAGSFLSILPLLIAFLLLQRQFIAGLTEGAVKG